jgi:hypothetical protein
MLFEFAMNVPEKILGLRTLFRLEVNHRREFTLEHEGIVK